MSHSEVVGCDPSLVLHNGYVIYPSDQGRPSAHTSFDLWHTEGGVQVSAMARRHGLLRRCTRGTLAMLTFLLNGCLTTPQSARIDPGPRVDVIAVALSDQERSGQAQRSDYLLAFGVAYGLNDVELGVPAGLYWTEGLGEQPTVVFMPYVKVGLLPDRSATHLALSMQLAGFLPANFGVHLSRDLGSWEPYVGTTAILAARSSYRYVAREESTILHTIGVTWLDRPRRPSLQAGVWRNRSTIGERRRSRYDLFVGLSLSFR